MERCAKCGKLSGFIFDGLCIQCSWNTIGQPLKVCPNCNLGKVHSSFHGKDPVCALCRKLIDMGLHYGHKLSKGLSRSTIFETGEEVVRCRSCNHLVNLDDFPINSFECWYCYGTRALTELQHHIPIWDTLLKCVRCEKPKKLINYPLGRLTCTSCIAYLKTHGP